MESKNFLAIFSTIILSTFIATSSAFTTSCSYKKLSLTSGLAYACDTAIQGSSCDQVITANTGTHLINLTNTDVTAIDIQGNKTLTFVPRGITKVFLNVVALRIFYSAIEVLNGDELNEIPNLKLFVILYSDLKTISSRLFVPTPNVKFISFAFNKITKVGHDLFAHLDPSRLDSIFMTTNVCISETAAGAQTIFELIERLKVECPYADEPTICDCGALEARIGELESELVVLRDELQKVTSTPTNVVRIPI
jgi:hypothetical protein